jgi:hypothetical protein
MIGLAYKKFPGPALSARGVKPSFTNRSISLAGLRTALAAKRPAIARGPNLQPSATQTQELIVDLVIRLNR